MKIPALLMIVLVGMAPRLFSQEFNVPAAYQLNAKEDYAQYEKDIIDATRWLQATPLNEQKEKRQKVSAFVIQWITGSPTVTVQITPVFLDFDKKNPGMMILYMACCARYSLENNYSKDFREQQKAALHDMIAVYKAGKGIKKDKKMEKLIASDEAGKLNEWLEENAKTDTQ